MSASLDGPLAKLDWAEKHLTRLDAEIKAFYAGNVEHGEPYKVRSEFRPDTSDYVFWIEVLREPPIALGLIFGDFVHSVRSALDHLVCQLARLNTPTSDCASTQYPITQTHTSFQQVAPNYLKGVRDTHRTAIKDTQPYKSGSKAPNHFLSLLANLDNVDKHRVIHPTFGFFSDPTPQPDLRFVPNRDAGVIRYKQIANGRRIKERQTEIVRLKLAPVWDEPEGGDVRRPAVRASVRRRLDEVRCASQAAGEHAPYRAVLRPRLPVGDRRSSGAPVARVARVSPIEPPTFAKPS